MAVTQEMPSLLEQDRRQLHPLHHPSQTENPLIIEHAEGVWLYTTDGRKILDSMAGLWNVNVGYGRTELAEAAYAQMQKLAYTSNFAGMTNLPASELAYKLSGYAYPSLKTTFFTSGGSESNDTAFKTARYYWKRQGQPDKVKVISRRESYHGITLATTSATSVPRYHKMFGPLVPNFVYCHAPHPYRYEGELQDGETVGAAAARDLEETILREGPETVAALIAEPVQGVGGVFGPPEGYVPRVRAICDKYDVLLIADEVICGFGRTGEMFALNRYGIEPDILAFAKGITSGYLPLGGIQISDPIFDAMNSAPQDEAWLHGFTYSGHAASCAVGLRNLAILEDEKLAERSAAMGEYLRNRLSGLREFGNVGDVRGLGLLCAVEFVKDQETREPDNDLALSLQNAAAARGVRTRALNGSLAFSPPLVINEEEIDQVVDTIGAVLDSMSEE